MIIQYKNIDIHYTDHGKGEAYILIHGFLENLKMWHPFIEDLSKTKRIICVDLLGHGDTGSLEQVHTMEMMADAVAVLIKNLNVKSCGLVGHSMGGYVALSMLERYPEIVNSIFLVNSTAKADSLEKKENRDRAIAAVKHDAKSFIRISVSNLFNPENKEKHAEAIKQITEEALKTPQHGIVAALGGMKIRENRTELLAHFTGKKWMLISEKDPVFELKSLLDEAEKTKVTRMILPDGHMSFIEQKNKFFETLMHFIEK